MTDRVKKRLGLVVVGDLPQETDLANIPYLRILDAAQRYANPITAYPKQISAIFGFPPIIDNN